MIGSLVLGGGSAKAIVNTIEHTSAIRTEQPATTLSTVAPDSHNDLLNDLPEADKVSIMGIGLPQPVEAPTTTTTTTYEATTTTTTSPPTTAPVSSSSNESLYDEWTKVAVCEEGGWVGAAGYDYPDSLGINRTNWFANGGGSDVSPSAQITVGEKIRHRYGIGIPDQHGCQPGGW